MLDADVSDCFGSIDHDALMAQVERRVVDGSMLKLIRAWLRAGVLEHGAVLATASGTPQGSPISPLLANIALHVLDEEWQRSGRHLGVLIRYADDYVIVCATRQRAEEAQRRSAAILGRLGLRLHPDKTRIVHLEGGTDGFDFLGFHHHLVESWKWRGRWYLHRWPSDRAMASIRSKVRELTESSQHVRRHRLRGRPAQPAATGLGELLSLGQLGAQVRPRRRVRARTTDDLDEPQARAPPPTQLAPLRSRVAPQHRRLPARASAGAALPGACPAMNDVGKPCAGEPHARFERGPLAKRRHLRETGEKPTGQRPVPAATTTNQRPTTLMAG